VKQIRKHITFANVMSSIAVFLVLGGGAAYAAKKIGSNEIKGNSITTGKLKKNAVTASKIKGNSITTAKIKNGAVTGPKINLTTLGTVPNATHATTADTATNFSRYFTSGLKKASVGNNVTLASIGPFTFTGKCIDLGGGDFEAAVYATTSAAGSFVYTAEQSGYSDGEFNPGVEQQIDYGVDTTGTEWAAYSSRYNSFSAASPNGSVLLDGVANSGVHVFGADCAFEVSATNGA
jgi:hypothetical protein